MFELESTAKEIAGFPEWRSSSGFSEPGTHHENRANKQYGEDQHPPAGAGRGRVLSVN